jgi:hypothetical protein
VCAPLRAAFTLAEDRALAGRPRLRLDMQTLLSIAGTTSRRHHPSPAEAHGALAGGEEQSQSGLLSVTTTDALFAGKVQCKVSNGVAHLAPRRFLPSQRLTNARADILPRDPGTRPELRIANVAAHTRIVSVVRIRLDSWKSVRPLKGIFCADISEFESDHLSHAVRSP